MVRSYLDLGGQGANIDTARGVKDIVAVRVLDDDARLAIAHMGKVGFPERHVGLDPLLRDGKVTLAANQVVDKVKGEKDKDEHLVHKRTQVNPYSTKIYKNTKRLAQLEGWADATHSRPRENRQPY